MTGIQGKVCIIGLTIILVSVTVGFMVWKNYPSAQENVALKTDNTTCDEAFVLDVNAGEELEDEKRALQLNAEEQQTMDRLRSQMGYLFQVPSDQGLTVCVWEDNTPIERKTADGRDEIIDSRILQCAITPGIIDSYSPEALYGRPTVGIVGIPPEEMKLVLSTYEVSEDQISVIPWVNPASSRIVMLPSEKEVEQVRNFLFDEAQ